MSDWAGHMPKLENFQLQFQDGSIIHLQDGQSDFLSKDEAVLVAKQLSDDWQVPIIVKQTS